MKVPFFNLERQTNKLKAELDKAALSVFKSSRFVSGQFAVQFEQDFARYTGANHCISCGNATDGLELVLRALEIGRGDEVIVPAFTWISDAEAVKLVGATPVFVEVDPKTYNISVEHFEAAITTNTKAVIFTHLFGYTEGFESVKKVTDKFGIELIEDCAQAHGALVDGSKVGTLGVAGVFSFYPTKNLGAYGDAGAVTTNDSILAERIRLLSNHGQIERDVHQGDGRNSRMDELQAAFLSVKLRYLDDWNQRRNEIASFYFSGINIELTMPSTSINGNHVYHQFVIRTERRDKLINKMELRGIGTAIHYPNPLPFLDAYHIPSYDSEFILSKSIATQILSLPIWPEMTIDEVEFVVEAINDYH